ncbi:fumarylacetoacetate hydrolase family protein, partial [Marinifilum sp. D714]|uniref:fumarylacetoacetate hydrolase family protein n=1 Tax=Marinifilum sp. D714 TaxID=2937523 RepID=UPI0027CD36AB
WFLAFVSDFSNSFRIPPIDTYLVRLSCRLAQEKDPKIALSLARVIKINKTHIIQVINIDKSGIKGLNLSEHFNYYTNDVFEFIESVGYDNIVSELPKIKKLFFKAKDVLPPVDVVANTIAVATNYPDHKDETNIEIDPVLFPKITELSSYVSMINTCEDNELLDYEVEMAIVYSKDTHSIDELKSQLLGFMVAIDYSERASMLRAYDNGKPELAAGFTDSKSHKGYFPVGSIVVIPRNWKSYYKNLVIQLYRNHILTQSDSLKSLIWDVSKITEEALQLGKKELWTYNNSKVSLLPKGYIEKGTITLTGTPGGVVFKPPTTGFIIKSIIKYVVFFQFVKWNANEYVRDQYVKKLYKQEQYLQNGESIDASISNLGHIYSTIQSQKEF